MSITKNNESLDSLTEKLVNVVFDEHMLNKSNVRKNIRSVLSIWSVLNTSRKKNENIKTSKEVLSVTLDKYRFDSSFWHNIFKEIVPENDRDIYYNRFQSSLKENGFEKFSK